MKKTSFFLFLTLGLCAQDQALRPPVLGRLLDPATNAISSVAGVPGAARMLPPVSVEGFKAIAVSPSGNFALGSAGGHFAVAVKLDQTPEVISMENLPGDATLAAFDTSGSTAAVYSPECGCVIVFAGLPDNPSVLRTEATSTPTAIALDDGGGSLAVAGAEAVTVFSKDSTAQSIPLSGVTGLAFGPGKQMALVRTDAREVWIVTSGEPALVISERDGLGEPIGAAFDRNGRLVAVDRAGAVWLLDRTTGVLSKTECGCAPEAVRTWNGGSVLLLNTLSATGPLWMVQLTDGEPRVFFVPVERAAGGAQ